VRIDAHQHFWRYSAREHAWIEDRIPIDGRMGRIARDFLPADLLPELLGSGFDGCVAVQARSTLAETEFLLALAREHPFVRGVVGWVDLCSPGVERDLERLAGDPLLKGVRHVVQDEPDPRFLLRPDFQRGVARLARHGLAYDLLVHPRHLEVARRFAAAFPEQPMVLDHLAKPAIARGERDPWERQFRALGELPHVACKLSGLVTEARWNAWHPADFRFYLDVALETFGEERVLFGSDWPVCLVAAESYRAVAELVLDWAAALTSAAREKLLGSNAARIYRLA
jgi:L-fuconolactonase